MRSCVDVSRRTCYWPTAACWESHCLTAACSPAWMPLGGRSCWAPMVFVYIHNGHAVSKKSHQILNSTVSCPCWDVGVIFFKLQFLLCLCVLCSFDEAMQSLSGVAGRHTDDLCEMFVEMRGHLYLHAGTLLLKLAQDHQQTWRAVIDLAALCFLLAYQVLTHQAADQLLFSTNVIIL